MLCYTLFKGEERKNQLILETGNKEIEVRQVDLSSMASVTNIAEDLLGRGKHIDLLMNNAGTMSSGGLITTEDGLEYTVAVNYVAPFLLTLKLLPLMGQGTRIVNMVSCTYSIGKITPEFLFVEREEVFGVSLFTAIQSWLCGFLPVNFLKG